MVNFQLKEKKQQWLADPNLNNVTMGTDGYFHYLFSYFFYTTKINIIILTKVINFKKLKKIHIDTCCYGSRVKINKKIKKINYLFKILE